MPLLGCLDLLLADIDQATARFLSSSDEKLREWLNNYPGEKLEAICIFCKNWLENDVLVGYRDIDLQEIDLNSWFQDREIQEFIEQLEKNLNRTLLKSKLTNQINFKTQVSQKDLSSNHDTESNNFEEGRLPLPGGLRKDQEPKQLINRNNLNDYIKIFDYLNNFQLISLYLNCDGVIMPTFIGHTTITMYEAFFFEKNFLLSFLDRFPAYY